jgi:uncharacterized membrane protein HdeD (DUF308 family)
MASDIIESAYRRTWWALVLRGLLGLALGIFILWRPMDSIASFALVIAIWALFSGIVQIVHAFDLRAVFQQWWLLLLSGLIGAGFGIAALYYYPTLSLSFAVAWAAFWLLLTGGLAVYVGIVERRIGISWGWTVAFGVVSIIVGVLAIMNPPVTLTALMGLISGFAIVSGIVLLIGAYRLSSAKQEVLNAVRSARA